jgi:hypothetical protein
MKKTRKTISVLLALVLCMISFVTMTTLVSAADLTTLHVQKTMYDEDVTPVPVINGDGTQINLDDYGVSAYDRTKYGEVGFTLYRVANGTVADEAALIALANQLNVPNPDLPAGVTVVGSEVFVNNSGIAEFANIIGGDDFFIIIETTSPVTVVTKANPLYLQLPVTNVEGTGYMSDPYLYPKNEVQPIEIDLTKHFNTDGSLSFGEGTVFELRSGTPGSGTVVQNMENLTPNPLNGMITVSDLTLGSYYFVEKPVAGLVEQGSGLVADDRYLVSPYARNDANNKLAFTINNDGTVTMQNDSLLGGLVNYDKPSLDKVVDSVDTIGYGAGNFLTYTVIVDLPENIADYTSMSFEDVVDIKDAADNTMDGLLIEFESDPVIYAGNGTIGTNLTTHFSVSTTDEAAPATPAKAEFECSTNFAAFLAALDTERVLTIQYKISLNPVDGGIIPGDDFDGMAVKNKVTGTFVTMSNDEVTDESETSKDLFGFSVEKQNSGFFGIGTGGDLLNGAEFVVRRESLGSYEYFFYHNNFHQDENYYDYEYLAIDAVTGAYSWVSDDSDAFVFVTDTNGFFSVINIPAGTYDVVEIKAPVGFRLPLDPVTSVTVGNDVPENQGVELTITNDGVTQFVPTGSQAVLMIAGVLVVLSAIVFIIVKKNKKEERKKIK